MLGRVGIEVEVIDVQTLLPFDLAAASCESLKKTSRMVFVDEDVPGGTTAYMMQQVLEHQDGYCWLDSQPRTVTSARHTARPTARTATTARSPTASRSSRRSTS